MLSAIDSASQQSLATPDDVHACYVYFLGRTPESPSAVAYHLRDQPAVWTLIRTFYNSSEALRRRVQQACAYVGAEQDGRSIEVSAEPDAIARLTDHIAEVWSRYGREEAYFSVLTNPKYLRERMKIAEIEEFYKTGDHEVADFEAILRRNGILPQSDWTVLELGCGVGRMAEHFARRYRSYVGVDISAEHLGLARARLDEKAVDNAELILLPHLLNSAPSYDVFFSVIVLQHNPPPIIYKLLDKSLAQLNPGGLACFQLPCHLYDYRFSVAQYLEGEGRHEHMEMHALPMRHVFALFAKHGLTPIEVTPNGRIGPLGFSYGFLARKTDQT